MPEPLTLARERVVPVIPALAGLLVDDGLVRGQVIGVSGPAATSTAWALVAGASAAGSWIAVVGGEDLGLAAAAEAGVALERLALVATPAPDQWATVVAALIGALDVVVVRTPRRVRTAEARRLAARARERGTILVQLGPSAAAQRSGDLTLDLRLVTSDPRWQGVGHGDGRLVARRVTIEASGRRQAARPRRVELWLPDLHGAIAVALPTGAATDRDAADRDGRDVELAEVG